MPGKSSLGSGKRLPSGGKKGHNEEVKKFLFWPEWTDAELNAEKWDTSGKGKDKGKGGATLYEDLDQPHLPSCLATSIVEWKRPVQFYQNKDSQSELSPVVVVPDKVELIDLISCNKHIIVSKLICKIISELHLLLRFRKKFRPINLPENDAGAVESWFPWQHIYPWPKGHAAPIYNPQGKYCVKIYWMGKWRKITVDDQLPIDGNGHILLPVSTHEGELWPLLITKAILKIINLEGVDGDQYDTNVIQALTGWFGEDVSLSDHDTWSLLQPLLKPWEREPIDQIKNEHDDEDSSCTIVVAFYYPPKEPIHKNSPCVSMSNQAHPIIMSKWRDEPLELPPLEPPLPPLQSPYYLGLCNRKPRPGYPPPPPPKTDHRSFEIYSPFNNPNNKATLSKPTLSKTTMSKATLSKTAMSKSDLLPVNDSTVNIYQSDIWIDLDEFEATFRKIMIFRKPDKFQSIDYDNLPSSSTNSQAPPTGVKKGITLQEEQQVTGNILMIDHCEDDPVKVYINYSSICSWYDGGKQMGLEPIPTLGMRRVQDITNKLDDIIDDYHSTPSVPPGESKETEEVESNYLLNEGKALSLVPGSLIIQEYTWQYNEGMVYSQNRFNNGLPRIITAGTKTVSLSFPKGRCILKLLMSAPIGYHVFVYSTVPLIMCKEEELWEHLKKPSRYYLSHGEKIIDLLTDLESDDTINKAIELLSQDTTHRHLTMNDFKALRVSLLRVLHVLGPEIGLDTAQLFAWKTRVVKTMEQINQQRQLSNEEEIEEEQDALIDMTRMREIDFMLGDREIKPQDHEKTTSDASGRKSNQVLKKTKNFDGEHELAINDKEESQLKDHDDDNHDVIDQLKNSVKCLQDNRKDLGVAIFKCLHAAKSDIITKKGCGFGTTVNNRVFHANYHGTIPYIEPKGWTVLFRDMFMVPCKQTIVLKLSSPCKSCIVKTIDNDTGTVIGTDLGPMELNRNEKGYTLIGEVWSFGDTIEGKDNWTLALLSTSPHLPTLMSGKDTSIITSFHVIETKKYYLPNRDFVICRYSITVSDDCHVSIQLNTSKSDACFTLEVLDCNQIISTVNGVGHCVIPSLQLCTILEENKEIEQPTINNTRKYIVQATVLYDSWSVGDSAWPYISTIKNTHKEAIQPHKPSSGKKNKGKGGGSGGGGSGSGSGAKTPKPSSASHDTVDISKPHWILRIIADSKNSQAIKVEEDKSKEEELKMMQQVWERDQPGRAKKAYQTRQKFLDSHSLPKEETTTTNNLTGSGGAIDFTSNIPHFGPVPLKLLNHEQYIVSCDECPPRVINYELETDRQSTRLNMVKEYREWRKGVLVKREIEATQRDMNKVKQIELVEDWQLQLDECRNKLNGPRESIRDRNMAKLATKSPTEDVPAARPPSKGKDAKGKTAKGKKK